MAPPENLTKMLFRTAGNSATSALKIKGRPHKPEFIPQSDANLRACFENISVGLAAGRGGWRRCSSVEDPRGIFSFVSPRHLPRRARNPFPDLFSKYALTPPKMEQPCAISGDRSC
jgi:hypothetical protein